MNADHGTNLMRLEANTDNSFRIKRGQTLTKIYSD